MNHAGRSLWSQFKKSLQNHIEKANNDEIHKLQVYGDRKFFLKHYLFPLAF